MKRVVAVALYASPLWLLSGIAGWWLGGGHERLSELRASIAPPKRIAPPPAPPVAPAPVPHEQASIGRPVTPPLVPVQPRLPRQLPQVQAVPEPAIVPPVERQVPLPPPPSTAPAAETSAPVASLGSTDVLAPEKELTPAPAVASNTSKAGVLIVVSLASQKAYVFKDGELWGSSAVSTGRKGKRTPTGRYTILEKQVRHRSRTYDNAPMPYMQRLTWGGVALHAGYVTGRPASHGCIRLPRSFAKKLYNLTDFGSTTVVVTDKKARSSDEALKAG
jgi:lipoprotein-anchoring transpeptidase ErfK/SrfK